MPRAVLGLSDNHDASAALVVDGQVVAAVSEERLDRKKNSGAFPARSIDCVLRLGGIEARDVEAIAIGTAFTPSALLRLLRDRHQQYKDEKSQFSYLLHMYILYQSALRRMGLTGFEKLLCKPLLRRSLARWRFRAPLVSIDHHTAHAGSAALTAPFDPALVLTLDAMGDGASVTVHRADGGQLTPLFWQSGLAATNTYYSRVTEYLGFTPMRHEGKVTGLAAFCKPPDRLVEHFASSMRFIGPGFTTTDYVRPSSIHDPFYRELGRYNREEIAAAAQANLERQVCDFVAYWCDRTGLSDIAVAGGKFANVKLNQRLHELKQVRSIFIYPHMTDGGLAAGAAMMVGGSKRAPIPTPYLGPEITEADAKQALDVAGLSWQRPDDMAETVAGLLANGKVVARAAGRLEWGPRALGNRSILYRPDDRSVNDWLNQRLRRTEFMPFAPSTRAEEARQCYEEMDGAEEAARFMTICLPCTPRMVERCAGVVHVDGTARPQIVRPEENPEYYSILSAFARRTGVGTVINTSFNMHEEPIVATAADAVKGWRDANLDALVLGPFLVLRDQNGTGNVGSERAE
jgi:carbamoyltransferase